MQVNRIFLRNWALTGTKKFQSTIIAALMISLFSLTSVQADNYVVTQYPTSDAAPMVFTHDGETRVYLYCTQDKLVNDGVYPIDTIHCYSSDDMFHWTDHGTALDERSCEDWANKGAHQLWAPTVVYYKGKYRLFVSAVDRNGNPDDGSARVFTALADSPTGPFIPDDNPRYLSKLSIGSIDPFCFIDTMANGETAAILGVRMGRGATSIHLARLNDDATDVVGDPWVVRSLPTDGYKEGTWIIKRNGFYYLIYATDRGGAPAKETIEYATAPVPAQGTITASTQWTYRGVIFTTNSSEFTIHSGVCHFQPKGQNEPKWYAFWHGVKEPEIGGEKLFRAGRSRCVGIEYMEFTKENPPRIKEAPKTSRGVGICQATTDSIQVDRFSSSNNCRVRTIQHPGLPTAPNGWVVSDIRNNGTCTYERVNFTPSEDMRFATVAANISSTRDNCSIEVRIGSNTGTLLATIPVPNTGNLNTYAISEQVALTERPEAGVHDIALVFKTPADNVLQVNWIKFEQEVYVSAKTHEAVINRTGFSFHRVNNNTFKVFCKENVANAAVSVMDLQGRAIVEAVSVRPFASNGVMVDLNRKQLSNGVYLLSVKTASQMKQVKFTY